LQITVKGIASGKIYKFETKEDENSETLLNWLKKKNIHIASSCSGEGICKKCVIQNNWLTCKLTLEEFQILEPSLTIEVAYL